MNCSVLFESTYLKPAITEKTAKQKTILYAHHGESIPIALLILAQISIACKELLTSLKQAILIKARIINSYLQLDP